MAALGSADHSASRICSHQTVGTAAQPAHSLVVSKPRPETQGRPSSHHGGRKQPHAAPSNTQHTKTRRRGQPDVAQKKFLSLVPRLDGAGAAKAERQRNAKRALEDAIRGSKAELTMKPAGEKPAGGKTHRDVAAERSRQSHACSHWAATIQDAVNDGIDAQLPDAVLSAGVQRIMELEEEAAEEEAAAKLALEARIAIAVAAVKTPFTKPGSKAALRAAAAQRLPLGEGSIVQLKGLEAMTGLTLGCIDVSLSKYNGRKGRVSQEPPPWCIKAIGGKAGEAAGPADARQEELGGLVPILLDSRSTDQNRHRGVWLAVPPSNLKVLSAV